MPKADRTTTQTPTVTSIETRYTATVFYVFGGRPTTKELGTGLKISEFLRVKNAMAVRITSIEIATHSDGKEYARGLKTELTVFNKDAVTIGTIAELRKEVAEVPEGMVAMPFAAMGLQQALSRLEKIGATHGALGAFDGVFPYVPGRDLLVKFGPREPVKDALRQVGERVTRASA